jgi:predicted kinase
MLISLSGLPGTGKTTIAREVARHLGAVYLRIDSIEHAMRDAGWQVEAEGYGVAYAVAVDNLRLGHVVVADCVNPWPLTRNGWRTAADRAGVRTQEVEIVCSDAREHRRRVETRAADIAGHTLPTWQDVVDRDYRGWNRERTVVDTARLSIEQCARLIVTSVRAGRA